MERVINAMGLSDMERRAIESHCIHGGAQALEALSLDLSLNAVAEDTTASSATSAAAQ